MNSLVYGSPFCVIIYTNYKLSEMVRFFSWLKLIGIFGAVWFLQTNAREYLNMATFRILVLLMIKSSTF